MQLICTSGTLPKILLSKFGLEMPKKDKRLLVFFPQLVQALEYHTNVYFSRDKKFVFASASNPEPFTEDDLVNYDCNFKFSLNSAGIFHRCQTIAEAFLASNMLPQAIVAFKIRLSTQNIFMRGMSNPNKKVKHEVHLTTYKLGLCYYLDKKHDLACSLLASILEGVRKGSPFLARILSLLMCADFKCDRVPQALRHYEVARHIYMHALGARHPVIALLYTTLADLYFDAKAFSHAKLLVYKALDFTQRTQGMKHIVNCGYYYKLGTILLEEGSYVEAMGMFQDAMDGYSLYATNGAEFGHEIAVCYHGLAIAEAQLGNISDAITHCKRSLSISTADDKYITAHAVSSIILLAEEHEKKQDLQETINLYSDAWTIVQAYAKDFDLPKILVIIAARIFSTFINKQAMNFRMLFHTIGAECEAKGISPDTLNKCNAFIAQELVNTPPVDYISRVFKLLTDGADNGKFLDSGVYTKLDLM
jgi:tetratricopeptide (TPR) repeat protein